MGSLSGGTQYNQNVTFTAINATTKEDDGRPSTTNTFGHWFNADGDVCTHDATAKCYAELNTGDWYFDLGTRPGHVQAGNSFTVTELFISKLNGVRVAIVIHFEVR